VIEHMIAQMAARLNAQRTLETALHTVLRDSADFLGAKFGTIWLLEETARLVLVAQRGFDTQFIQSFRSLAVGAGHAASRAAADKRPIAISNIDDDAQFAPFREAAHSARFIALHATPLVAHTGACVGVMAAYFSQQRTPTSLERDMLETYGKIAADRFLALLGPGPRSLRTQELFEHVLTEAEARERKALAMHLLCGSIAQTAIPCHGSQHLAPH
jgi:GAF domain-containing protein